MIATVIQVSTIHELRLSSARLELSKYSYGRNGRKATSAKQERRGDDAPENEARYRNGARIRRRCSGLSPRLGPSALGNPRQRPGACGKENNRRPKCGRLTYARVVGCNQYLATHKREEPQERDGAYASSNGACGSDGGDRGASLMLVAKRSRPNGRV